MDDGAVLRLDGWIDLLIHLSIKLKDHPSIYPTINLRLDRWIDLLIHLSIKQKDHPSVYPTINLNKSWWIIVILVFQLRETVNTQTLGITHGAVIAKPTNTKIDGVSIHLNITVPGLIMFGKFHFLPISENKFFMKIQKYKKIYHDVPVPPKEPQFSPNLPWHSEAWMTDM